MAKDDENMDICHTWNSCFNRFDCIQKPKYDNTDGAAGRYYSKGLT